MLDALSFRAAPQPDAQQAALSWPRSEAACQALQRRNEGDPAGSGPARLPAHLSADVCRACLRLARRIAMHGLHGRRPHLDFAIVVGDAAALGAHGRSAFNAFKGHSVCLIDGAGALDEDRFELVKRNGFCGDGALVVDGLTAKVDASAWFPGGHPGGIGPGVAGNRAARFVAQQAGGCFVIVCAESSRGALVLHGPDVVEHLLDGDRDINAVRLPFRNC